MASEIPRPDNRTPLMTVTPLPRLYDGGLRVPAVMESARAILRLIGTQAEPERGRRTTKWRTLIGNKKVDNFKWIYRTLLSLIGIEAEPERGRYIAKWRNLSEK